jgi:hypothetical protein
MTTSGKPDYESLPFLNVFSPEYAKDPLAAIRALGKARPWRGARVDWNA